MRRSALDSPLFHGRSDYLRNRGVELSALVDRAVQRLVDVLRQARLHHLIGKYVLTEHVREHFLAFLHLSELLRAIFRQNPPLKNHFRLENLPFCVPLYHFALLC